MYYRWEGRRTDSVEPTDWKGIFQCFSPKERRKWYCLCVPKWYNNNENIDTQSWFTQHGYEKWHEKMEETIKDFLSWNPNVWEIRLLVRESLNNIVFSGKTQCIMIINREEENNKSVKQNDSKRNIQNKQSV